jgi:hypothetical protein
VTAHLLCVDPAQVRDFWPHVEPLIKAACARGLHDFGGTLRSLERGTALLWLVSDGEEIFAALTTELHKLNERKVCFISTLGGRQHRQWVHLVSGIEDFARAEGCEAVLLMGRKGWLRAMPPSWRQRGIIMERALT